MSSRNILVTAFNNHKDFFHRGLVLIAALHRHSFDSIDKILVYNLGFDYLLKKFLDTYAKVSVVEFPESPEHFDGYLNPGTFAWKCIAIKDAAKFGDNILWIDAGIVPLKDIKVIFDTIQSDGIFMVSNPPELINKDWTDEKCFEIMNASENEKNSVQIAAGIIGYNINHPNKIVIDQAFEFSKIKEAITGSKKHRHDQSIYSVLAARYEIPLQKTELYAEWRGIKSVEQVLYVHRGKVTRKDGLIQKADKSSIDENESIVLNNTLNKMKSEAMLRRAKLILRPFLLPIINFLKKR